MALHKRRKEIGIERIESLGQFIDWVEHFKDGVYLYRGLPKAKYVSKQVVIPSAQYHLEECERTSERLLEDMRVLTDKARNFGHHRKDGRELSDLELLAELQHFGAATCLIDFTYNALIALWFACRKSIPDPEKDGKVVVLRSDRMEPLRRVRFQESQEESIDKFLIDKTVFAEHPIYQWTPRIQNNRVIAQDSVFVFSGGQIKIDGECEIRGSSKSDILIGLEEFFGIREEHLFSDVPGFAWLHGSGKAPHIQSPAKAYRLRGIDAFHSGELDQAITNFSDSIEDKNNLDTYLLRATAYWRKVDVNWTPAELRAAIKDHEVIIESAIKDCEVIIESYKSVKSSDEEPDDKMKRRAAKAYNIRGNAYLNTADILQRNEESTADYFFSKALADYNDAIKLDRNLLRAYSNRAVVHSYQKNFDEAIADYDVVIEREPEPDVAYAYCNRGETLLHMKEWSSAIEDLKKAKVLGLDIKRSFNRSYENLEDFKARNGITCDIPQKIVELLEGEVDK